MQDRRHNEKGRAHFDGLRTDLERRLAHACAHMKGDELDSLTAKMTRMQVRFETTTGLPDRFVPTRLFRGGLPSVRDGARRPR